jgi:hypothetical protein
MNHNDQRIAFGTIESSLHVTGISAGIDIRTTNVSRSFICRRSSQSKAVTSQSYLPRVDGPSNISAVIRPSFSHTTTWRTPSPSLSRPSSTLPQAIRKNSIPYPHHLHHPLSRYPSYTPKQTQSGNGKNLYNNLSYYSAWLLYHILANTLGGNSHIGDGRSGWNGNFRLRLW